MGVLVEDMLQLARLDQQRSLDFRTVDLLAIAADALHDARVIAPKRAINLTVGTPDAPLVTGDEVGLRQVVGNLMSNAMTHTPDGTPIEITIRSGTLGNGHGPSRQARQLAEPAVILEVTDHGAGLTEDQREHVFERFYRTDRARSRTAGGTGLGLAIVSAMVSAHHGTVWVDLRARQGRDLRVRASAGTGGTPRCEHQERRLEHSAFRAAYRLARKRPDRHHSVLAGPISAGWTSRRECQHDPAARPQRDRDNRWRSGRLQHRLPAGQARQDRRDGDRAQAAHRGQHLARGRAHRPASHLEQPDRADAPERQHVSGPRAPDRLRHRLA